MSWGEGGSGASRPLARAPSWLTFLLILVALGIFAAVAAGLATQEAEPLPAEDPERARFMLDCMHEWDFTPPQRHAMLRGENPPPLPDESPGC